MPRQSSGQDTPFTVTTEAQVRYLHSVEPMWVLERNVCVGYVMSGLRSDIMQRMYDLADPSYKREFARWWTVEAVNLPG